MVKLSDRYYRDTPIAELIANLNAQCEKRGLTLSRWQTASRRCSYVRTTTYAIHRGERNENSYRQSDVVSLVRFSGNEGRTGRCTAYQAIQSLERDLYAEVR